MTGLLRLYDSRMTRYFICVQRLTGSQLKCTARNQKKNRKVMKTINRVCVRRRPSAMNMTQPAFAAVRCQSIRLARGTLSSKPAARCSGCRTTGQTAGRTDGRTSDRCIDPAPHTMWALSSTQYSEWSRGHEISFEEKNK